MRGDESWGWQQGSHYYSRPKEVRGEGSSPKGPLGQEQEPSVEGHGKPGQPPPLPSLLLWVEPHLEDAVGRGVDAVHTGQPARH